MKILKRFTALLTVLIIMFTSAAAVCAKEESLGQGDFVHAEGRNIIGTDGKKLEIRGMALGNGVWTNSPTPAYKHHTEKSYKELSEMGFNCVRFYLNYGIFESDDNPYHYRKMGFEWLDRNIEWAKKYNMGIILNMHFPQGGYQSQGNGMALWEEKENGDRLTALWKEIARRYANEPTIWGYGLINEPGVPLKDSKEETIKQYTGMYKRIIKAIRSVSPYQAIFAERLCFAKSADGSSDWSYVSTPEDAFCIFDDDNVIYEFHTYDPFCFTHQNAAWAGTAGAVYSYPSDEMVSADYGKWTGAATSKSIDSHNGWKYFESEKIALTDNYNTGYICLKVLGNSGNSDIYFDNITLTEISPEGKNSVKFYLDCNNNAAGGFGFWSSDGTGGISDAPDKGIEGGCVKISGSKENVSATAQRFTLKRGFKYYISGYVKNDTGCNAYVTIDLVKSDNIRTLDKQYLDDAVKPYWEFSQKHNVPVYAGEFGVISEGFKENRGGGEWVSDMIDIFRKYDIGFNYHAYHEGSFGLYRNDSDKLPDDLNKELAGVFRKKLKEKR